MYSINTTNECNAILKNGKRKGQRCNASKKIDLLIDNIIIPRCNRHNKDVTDMLNNEQKRAYNLCTHTSENIFITGPGGVGKSFLINIIKQYFIKNNISYGLTSSTGISSVNINGQTIQSFFGIPIHITKIKHVKCQQNNKLIFKPKKEIIMRIKYLDVLIIDEISMLNINIFEIIEFMSRKIRKNEKIFGGIKIILIGDFFQLPPVPDNDDKNNNIKYKFCFESYIWKYLNLKNVILNESYRQKDNTFYDILKKIRLGNINKNIINIFKKKNIFYNEIKKYSDWTILFSSNSQKNIYNNIKLKEINNETKIYKSLYKGKEIYKNTFFNIPDTIKLKINCRIILIKNIKINNICYVNGDRGKVIDFNEENNPVVIFERFPKNKVIIEKQIWKTYDMTNPLKPSLLAEITQIPIILSWATTIHKSQGLTLDKVIIDFSHIFLKGQAYVALSRCKNLNELKILNFNYKKILVNKKIIKFYEKIKDHYDNS